MFIVAVKPKIIFWLRYLKLSQVIHYKRMYLLTMLDAFLKKQGRFYSNRASPDILLKISASLMF